MNKTALSVRMRGEMGSDNQSDYGPTWYSGIVPLPAARTQLNHDIDVDVCVVGGGLAGLTVAREVARRGWSVALIEARRIAWAASGRNSGLVLPGFSAQIEKVIERIGLAATKALWELSESGVRYVRDTVAEIGVPGIMEGKGWLDVFKTPETERVLARVRLLEQEMAIAVEGWPVERVRSTLKSGHYFDAIHFPYAFQINPLAYAFALAAAAERAGARIFENTAATGVDPAGVRKRIETPQGRVRAGHVVLAGNIHLGAVAQQLADTLIPVVAITGVTQHLGARLAEAIAFRGAVGDSRHTYCHYRVVDGDRLLWTGPAVAPGLKGAQQRLERELAAIYPQLGPAQFEHFWRADMGFAVHGMPQIGEVQPGVWLASAFGGQGLNTSAMAGDLIARGIVEGDDTWRHFLPFELVWAGGGVGRTVARATAWWWHASEAVAALAARRREELGRRRREGKLGLAQSASQSAYRGLAAAKQVVQRRLAAGEHERPIGAPEAAPGPPEHSGRPRAERARPSKSEAAP